MKTKKIKVFHDYCEHEYEDQYDTELSMSTSTEKQLIHETILIKNHQAFITQIFQHENNKIYLETFSGKIDDMKFDSNHPPINYSTEITARLAEAIVIEDEQKKNYVKGNRQDLPLYDIAFGNAPKIDYSGTWKSGFPLECIKVDPDKHLELGKRYIAVEVWGEEDNMQVVVQTEKGNLIFYKERFKVIS